MRKLLVLFMVIGLLSGCALKTWFCKLDFNATEATLVQSISKIQSDYAYWVTVRDNLRASLAVNPTNQGVMDKLAGVLNYLGLADQFLATGFGVLKDVQNRVCAVQAADLAVAKATEALAVKPL